MRRLIIILAAALAPLCSPVSAEDLATDLSDHEIAITSSFAGTSLLLFGTRGAEPGDVDIIVAVRGPETPMKVWRKQRFAGIWINSEPVTFANVPGYYAVASNRPLEDITSADYLRTNNIGPENLVLLSVENISIADARELRTAIIDNRSAAGLYLTDASAVTFPPGGLFRTDIIFPANVPVGDYRILVLLMKDGVELDRTSTILAIGKQGIEQQIYSFAYERPALYGLIAVVLAVVAGWTAAMIFRSS